LLSCSDNLPYEKVGKNEPICIAEEVPFDIPDSWEWIRVDNISKSINAGGDRPKICVNKKSELCNIPIFSNGEKLNGLYGYTNKAKIVEPSITISGRGTIGFSCVRLEPYTPIVRLISITPFKYIDLNYLQIVFTILLEKGVGTSVKQLTVPMIKPKLIPLPPFKEQQRIVNKLKELEPYIKEYDVAYEKIEKLNNNFPEQLKKSILQDAVQGKLVPQNPNDEPASVLIERIREEKQKLIQEKKIKKDKKESNIFRRDNSHYEKIGSEERCIDDEIPFDIPDNWEWCYLNDVTSQIHYGYTASASSAGNVKLTRITDIQNNRVNWETVPFCLISEDNLKKYKLENRDILIARTGGTIGKTYIVRNLSEKAVFASYLIRAIPLQSINEEYLKLFMESPLYWEQLKAFSMGTGQPNVNGQSLSKLKLPLPPLEEQRRIVEKIKTLMPIIEIL